MPPPGTFYSSPMVENGLVFVTSGDGGIYTLNAATGAKIHVLNTSGVLISSPVLAGGFVYFGSENGDFYAVDATTSVVEWYYSIGTNIDSSAAVSGGSIFFAGQNGYVYSLSTGGVLRWSTLLPSGGQISSPLCVANGVVYVRDSYYTYALDQNSGAILTTMPVGSAYGGPVVVDGAVFAGDVNDGVLTRYTPNALQSGYVAPRPDPMQLRPHRLR